jgi:hypothetical protein
VNAPRGSMDRGSRVQLWAILFVTLLVMALGVAVVLAPAQMGVPRPAPTAIATPVASPAP